MELTITEDIIIKNLVKSECKYVSDDSIDRYINEYIETSRTYNRYHYKPIKTFSFFINEDSGRISKIVPIGGESVKDITSIEELGKHILFLLGIPELESEDRFYSYTCIDNKITIIINEYYEMEVIEFVLRKLKASEETIDKLVKAYDFIVAKVEELRKFANYGFIPHE